MRTVEIVEIVVNFLFWALTVVMQAAAALAGVFTFSALYPQPDLATIGGWLFIPISVWASYTVGISVVGWAALRVRRLVNRGEALARVGWVALGAGIPALALVAIALAVGPGNRGEFEAAVLGAWQPILLQLAMLTGIAGFYVPGWIRRGPSTGEEAGQDDAGPRPNP